MRPNSQSQNLGASVQNHLFSVPDEKFGGSAAILEWSSRLVMVLVVLTGGLTLASGPAVAAEDCDLRESDGECSSVGITEDESGGVAEHSLDRVKNSLSNVKGGGAGIASARGAIGSGAGGGVDTDAYYEETD